MSRMVDLYGRSEYMATCSPEEKKRRQLAPRHALLVTGLCCTSLAGVWSNDKAQHDLQETDTARCLKQLLGYMKQVSTVVVTICALHSVGFFGGFSPVSSMLCGTKGIGRLLTGREVSATET